MLLTRLNIDEVIDMSSGCRKRYTGERSSFISANNRDKHYHYSFKTDIPFTEEHTLVYNDDLGMKPLYASMGMMCLLDILAIGWIQRIFLEAKTYEVKYKLTKYLES